MTVGERLREARERQKVSLHAIAEKTNISVRFLDAIEKNLQTGNKLADAAATMTDTTVQRRILGVAAPQHFNKPIAEAANRNIQAVGLPQWTADEQAFAKAVQKNLNTKEEGLAVKLLDRPLCHAAIVVVDESKAPRASRLAIGRDDDLQWIPHRTKVLTDVYFGRAVGKVADE